MLENNKLQDKNGRTMETGDIVKVENAYFKNDNGYFFITNSPGDPLWCGSYYSLMKLGKTGKISTAKYNLGSYPISIYTNDREKRILGNEHNKKYATIEVVDCIPNDGVIAYFTEERKNADENADYYEKRGMSGEVERYKNYSSFNADVLSRLMPVEAEKTPENDVLQEEANNSTPAEENRVKYYDIDENLARRAWESVHMGEYKTTTTEEYRAQVDKAYQLADAKKKKVSEFYHNKIDYYTDVYSRKLATWYNDYNKNQASCPSWFICGSANYPTRKHERQMSRESSLWEEYNKIKGILEKIKSIGTGAIDLTDPHAKEMLQERLENLQSTQERYKAMNQYWRKHNSFVGFPGISEEKAREMTDEANETMRKCPWIRKPIPDYEMTSIREKIKRTKERLETLEGMKEKAETGNNENTFSGGVIVRNYEENRLQILFDEIPDEETRFLLKKNGFRWSPKNKAWQRQLTQNAEYSLKKLNLV